MKPKPSDQPEEESKKARKVELERLIQHKTVQALRELDALIEGHLQTRKTAQREEEITDAEEDVEE